MIFAVAGKIPRVTALFRLPAETTWSYRLPCSMYPSATNIQLTLPPSGNVPVA